MNLVRTLIGVALALTCGTARAEWRRTLQGEAIERVEHERAPLRTVKGGDAHDGKYLPYQMVCRGFFQNGLHPGKLLATQDGIIESCHIAWGGKEVDLRHDFDALFLLPDTYEWVHIRKGEPIPGNAVKGGDSDEKYNDPSIFICRVRHINGTHGGKILTTAGHVEECHIGYAGKEIGLPDYEILVRKGEPEHRPPEHHEGEHRH